MPLPQGEDLCQFTLKSVHSFSKYSVHKLVTDEQTDRRTDEGTGREHYAFVRSRLSDVRINTVYVRYRNCVRVFCHAERVLSAIAKFLVYFLGKRGGCNGRGDR